MIKAVIFDIDGVLLDSFEANFKFFCDLMDKFNYSQPKKDDYKNLFHKTMRDAIRALTNGTEEEVQKIWQAGKDREVLYPVHLLQTPAHLEEIIELLSEKYILGIVTSRVVNNIYDMPQLAKLEKYFKATVSYEDTENHKPHPDPLLLVAQKLNLTPEECVYVGDVEGDLLAAKAAGMKSIIYSEKFLKDADANTPVFTELPELIKNL